MLLQASMLAAQLLSCMLLEPAAAWGVTLTTCVWGHTLRSQLHRAPCLPLQVLGAQARHQAAQLPQPLQLVAWEALESAAATQAARLTLAARLLAAQAPAHLAAAMVPPQALAVTAPP